MDNSSIDEITRSLREEGLSLRAIGERLGLSHQAIYFRLGGKRTPLRTNPPPAANDNKIVKMMPHNGGCSTVSGVMPVSLRRVPTMDVAEVALDARELQAVAA
ncbi:helix-turn-helix transcriptional regulator [Rhizobium laguerreae]|uniref:helix-turn-helix transcriptional regulator n=1 Tax=Rhizobium laguerreae TaxID=1076926 RepID=UPI001C90CABC|nr:helix-turn-helix transcriptional regulator [Rhizobium laguerreae]